MVKNTRITIDVDGTPRLLLSVREKSHDELLLILKHAQNYENEDGSHTPIKEQRYTLHSTRNSPTNTFKQTIALADGRLIETVNCTLAIHRGEFCYLFSRRPPSLNQERYLSRNRRSDQVANLGSYDPRFGSIVHSIIVGRAGYNLTDDNHPDFRVKHCDFGAFRITILFSFFAIPADPSSGDIIHYMTSLPRINRAEIPAQMLTSSHSAKEAITFHRASTGALAATMVRRVAHFVPRDIDILVYASRRVTAQPPSGFGTTE